MAIIKLKPTTNGRRDMSINDRAQVTAKKPSVRSLLSTGKKVSGRANGTITTRHRGGGTRPQYRKIDFSGVSKLGVPAKVAAIEYDPNRSCFIMLLNYIDGDRRYQLAHRTAQVGDSVITADKAKMVEGNRMQLKHIPVGFSVFNIEMTPNKGGQMVRSAGGSAKLVSLDGEKAQIELPSGEIRLVEKTNYATIGVLSNEEHNQVRIGKAGRKRHMGRRPSVRGKAMNPVDHPHGGGEGGTSIGMAYPKTPWGAHALGVKTRRNKSNDKLILRSRHRAKKR
jgi:large subunit ribosomal protein L2